MNVERHRLAVLGSPISHSKSPRLHRAAYAQLGLSWQYDAIDVVSDDLASFLSSAGSEWRGLSLTMPLKRTVLPLLEGMDNTVLRTGGANTVYFDDSSGVLVLRGFNTDVYGIVSALRSAGISQLSSAQILGSGATAASALLAASILGVTQIVISARTPSHAVPLENMAEALGISLEVRPLGAAETDFAPEAVISTIPGGADRSVSFSPETMARSVLLEVAYDPWPTPLAASWLASDSTAISGVEMLLHQALAQVRIFVGGSPDLVLSDEVAVIAAMRRSLSDN